VPAGASVEGASTPPPATRASRLWERARALPLPVKYVTVSGVIGVPLSILQLQIMLAIYRYFAGENPNIIVLNALWLINFELGLSRNFLGHCWYSWGMPPTRRRWGHAHVAALGALVIDLIAFNLVYLLTDVILAAQIVGAGAGFFCNFLYNKFMTFAHAKPVTEERDG